MESYHHFLFLKLLTKLLVHIYLIQLSFRNPLFIKILSSSRLSSSPPHDESSARRVAAHYFAAARPPRHAPPAMSSRLRWKWAIVVNEPLENIYTDIGFNGDTLAEGLVVSICLGGAFVESLLSGWIADGVERRRAFQLCSLPMIIGASVSASTTNLVGMLLGRFLIGTGLGVGPPVASLYITGGINRSSSCCSGPVCINFSSEVPIGGMLTCLCAGFVFSFAAGAGPVPGLLLPEIFPNRIRAKAMAFCMSVHWFFNFLVGLLFLRLLEEMGPQLLYTMFGTFCLMAVVL